MGLIEDAFKGNLAINLAIGIAATILGPVVIPIVARTAKPAVKAAIRGGLLVCEAGRAKLSSAREGLGDLVTEAKKEMERGRQPNKEAGGGLGHIPPSRGPGPAPESPL
ncbi:MAG: DUF5132 domain-containing protein [Syntrophorhabdales bacterium]|jgi:hypothetical protein